MVVGNVQRRLERVVQTGCRKRSKKAGTGHQPSERNVRNVQRRLERNIGNTRFKEGWNGSETFKEGWNGSTIGTDRQKRAAKKAETVIGNVQRRLERVISRGRRKRSKKAGGMGRQYRLLAGTDCWESRSSETFVRNILQERKLS